LRQHLLLAVAENIARLTVDQVDAEAPAPVAPPVFLVEALDNQDELFYILRNRLKPGIILLGIISLGVCEELDDGAQ